MMERALAEYIVNTLWQVPLLAGSAWLLLHIVRPGPQVQHRVWLAALGLAVLLPVRGMAPAAVSAPQPRATIMVAQQRVLSPVSSSQSSPRFYPHFYPRTRTVHMNATAARWLVRLYLATVAFAVLRIARAWFAARQLVAGSRETSHHSVALAHYSRRLRVELPQLRESGAVSSPMIVGVRAPVLLVPEDFARFAEDEVRAALCHELAHIQRSDYLMNMVCQLAAVPLAWHPVMDQIQQRIRMTREMVCDAMAAQEMQSHIGYARCLLALAHSMLGGRDMARQTQFLGLFSNNTLEERIMRLMETTTMSLRAKVARATSGAAVMIAAGSLAAMFHVTPTMAELRDAAPQAEMQTAPASTQSQPNVSEPQSSPFSVAGKPAGRGTRTKRTYIRRDKVDQELIDKQVKEQVEEAKRQIAQARIMLDDPAFKQQMEEAQRQMAKARVMLDSPEFKQQMEEAQRQMSKAKAMFESPEFKRQMEDAQRQAFKASAMLNNPEFKEQMEHLQEQILEQFQNGKFDCPPLSEPALPGKDTPGR